ncbi:MAG: hypothetical protein C6I05_06720 [Epsilonproteobacteria bacterium]|nr:hypothetical protein [Campylobacterota bacterium]
MEKRVFLLNSIYREELQLFKSRWALSFLKGPLTKEEISRLMEGRKGEESPSISRPLPKGEEGRRRSKPLLSPEIEENFEITDPSANPIEFEPYIYSRASLYYYNGARGIEKRIEVCRELPANGELDLSQMEESECRSFHSQPPEGALYGDLNEKIELSKNLKWLEREWREALYKRERLTLYRVEKLRLYSREGEGYEDFRDRVLSLLEERRSREIERVQERFSKKIERLRKRIENYLERLEKEEQEVQMEVADTLVSIGEAIFGSLLGDSKRRSKGSLLSKAKRAYREYQDLSEIKEKIEEVEKEIAQLQEELHRKIEEIRRRYSLDNYPITPYYIKPRKRDIEVKLSLLWRQRDPLPGEIDNG